MIKRCLAAMLIIIVSVSMTCALEMKEQARVEGNGSMSGSTNIQDANDRFNARGDQNYSRYFSMEDDSSYLKTSYACKNIPKNDSIFYNNSSNYYYISGKSEEEIRHSISVKSNTSFETSGTVQRNGNVFSTNYEMKSRYGNLSETLTERIGATPNYLAELNIVNANFTLSSAVSESLTRWPGYEVADQMLKMSSVKMFGDPERDAQLSIEMGKGKTNEDVAAGYIQLGLNLPKDTENDEKALEYYEKALSIDKTSANAAAAWRAKGNVHYRQKLYTVAITDYEEAIKINDELREAWTNKGLALMALNQTEDAFKFLDKTTLKFPSYADAWYYRGGALKTLNRYQEALDSFNKTLELDSSYSMAWFSKGKLLYELAISRYNSSDVMLSSAVLAFENSVRFGGNKALADKYLEMVKNINPSITTGTVTSVQIDIEDLEQRAATLIQTGLNLPEDSESDIKALEYYNQALALDNKTSIASQAWRAIGNVHYRQRLLTEAIADYNKSINIDPENKDAWLNKGIVLMDLNRTANALDVLEKAVQLFPSYADAWYNRGGALKREGKLDEALDSFNKTLELDPNYSMAWFSKGKSLYELATTKYDNSQAMLTEARTAFNEYIRNASESEKRSAKIYIDEIDKRLISD